jgi:hypothetical protein
MTNPCTVIRRSLAMMAMGEPISRSLTSFMCRTAPLS